MATSPDTKVDILVVGAGPSGLVAALQLAWCGVHVRAVDFKSGPVEQVRAPIVHARTLKYLDSLGLASQAIEQGVPIDEISRPQVSHSQQRSSAASSAQFTTRGTGRSEVNPMVISHPLADLRSAESARAPGKIRRQSTD